MTSSNKYLRLLPDTMRKFKVPNNTKSFWFQILIKTCKSENCIFHRFDHCLILSQSKWPLLSTRSNSHRSQNAHCCWLFTRFLVPAVDVLFSTTLHFPFFSNFSNNNRSLYELLCNVSQLHNISSISTRFLKPFTIPFVQFSNILFN